MTEILSVLGVAALFALFAVMSREFGGAPGVSECSCSGALPRCDACPVIHERSESPHVQS